MNRLFEAGLCGLLLLGCAAPASAAAVVFNNEAAFQAATGATLHELKSGVSAASVSTVDNELTLTAAAGATTMITDWGAIVGISRLAGVEMAISGPESFNGSVSLGADRYAFGFGIYESTDPGTAGCNFACTDSTFTITLKNNGVALAPSFTLSPADNVASFWGVHTDFAFDAIEIRETIGTADNEIFGTFYTGQNRAGVLPEPGTLLLVGAALAIASGTRRRMH